MKFRLALLLLILALPLAAAEKKTLTFQPGAKQPDGHEPPVQALPIDKSAIDASSADAPAQFASIFFALLQKGDIDGAYESLTRGSKIAERPEELKALKTKTKEAIEVFGAIIGFQQVESKNVSERLLRRTYVSLGRDFPLRWRLYFYKPDLAWRLIDLRVDDRLSGMFDEQDEPRAAEPKP